MASLPCIRRCKVESGNRYESSGTRFEATDVNHHSSTHNKERSQVGIQYFTLRTQVDIVSLLSLTYKINKTKSERINLKQEGFVLVFGLRKYNPSWQESRGGVHGSWSV